MCDACTCAPSGAERGPFPFVGFRRADRRDCSGTAGMPQCAQVLYGGAVVGTVVGRQEVGPRALGHRSLLAYPGDATMRDRINRIKARQWYRLIVCAEQVAVRRAPNSGQRYRAAAALRNDCQRYSPVRSRGLGAALVYNDRNQVCLTLHCNGSHLGCEVCLVLGGRGRIGRLSQLWRCRSSGSSSATARMRSTRRT